VSANRYASGFEHANGAADKRDEALEVSPIACYDVGPAGCGGNHDRGVYCIARPRAAE
jgi:hypothetical protein